VRCRVVTVTFRSTGSVGQWADALERSWRAFDHVGEHRLIVVAVDNGSADGTVELLRSKAGFVTTLALSSNLGFAAGCNRGLATAEPDELLVIINPDVIVAESFFTALARLDWPDDLAARGPRVIGADGLLEQSARGSPTVATGLFGRTSFLARRLPANRWVRRELRATSDAEVRDVDWISGACMVIPASRWAQVGPFDEGYFMYWEDADWCHRARGAGLRVSYEAGLVVHHHQGSSSASRPFASIVAFHRSAWRYQRRHGSGGPAMLAVAAVGLAARAIAKLIATAVRRLKGGPSGASAKTGPEPSTGP
jgi:GT2 family glycosyltransferase